MIEFAVSLLTLVLMVPLGWFTLEVVCGLTPLRSAGRRQLAPAPSCVLVIPAHNESGGIGETVSALVAAMPEGCRVLVVADNCTDDTAAVARAAGADVIERVDPARRGKGYALAFARDHLAQMPPEVVIIIDADCRFAPGSIEALVASVQHYGQPAQAVDVILPDLALHPLGQISGFAMLVKNHARLRGLQRLGGISLLCGTGMAFAWKDLAHAPLATGDVVEDLGLAVTMISAGRRPQLVEAARVTSQAAGLADSVAQRSRWEHGFIGTARRRALPALWRGITRWSRAEFALGMHLLVPPLALLMALAGFTLVLSAVLAALTGFWLSTLLLASAILVAGVAVLLVWRREGRQTLSSRALLAAPLYVLWKLPIYLRLIAGTKVGWNRTRREGEL